LTVDSPLRLNLDENFFLSSALPQNCWNFIHNWELLGMGIVGNWPAVPAADTGCGGAADAFNAFSLAK
jgi:hypothetical protein